MPRLTPFSIDLVVQSVDASGPAGVQIVLTPTPDQRDSPWAPGAVPAGQLALGALDPRAVGALKPGDMVRVTVTAVD
jgi:hypothetical protein